MCSRTLSTRLCQHLFFSDRYRPAFTRRGAVQDLLRHQLRHEKKELQRKP